jgi:hypothetical protein
MSAYPQSLPVTDPAKAIGSVQVYETTWQVLPDHTLIKRLIERRISPETITEFAIEPNGKGWSYPAAGGKRWKNHDSDADPKYAWIGGKPANAEFYHGAELIQAIQATHGACWFASGEPDVWALHSAGITHALSGFTESRVSQNLAQYLSSLGVTLLLIAPDRDNTGEQWACKVAAALAGSGIELDCRVLPEDLGEHGDIGKAWQQYTKLMNFERWLMGLPRVYPEPMIELKSQSYSVQSVVPDNYRLSIIERLGVYSFGIDDWSINSKGKSVNVLCPFHKDTHPSASVNKFKGLYCHTEGTSFTWQQIGIQLGIGSIAEWRKTHQATVQVMLSNEIRAALIKIGHTSTARVLDALYSLGWQPGRVFSRAEAEQVLVGIVKAWSLRMALEPDTTKDKHYTKPKLNYCGFFPSFSLKPVSIEKTHKKSKGRQSKQYILPAPKEIAMLLDIDQGVHSDIIAFEKILNHKKYRADVYASLPKLNPGTYARKTLCKRVGISTKTAQSYDKLAGLIVTERYDRKLLSAENIADLPEHLESKAKRNRWLENGEIFRSGERAGKHRRFTSTREGAKRAQESSPTGEIWLVTQLTNHYRGSGDNKKV